MASENIVTWNVTNWITVVLMVSVGFMVLGALGMGVAKIRARKADNG